MIATCHRSTPGLQVAACCEYLLFWHGVEVKLFR